MTLNKLDHKTYFNSNVIQGESKYKTPLLINKEVDFILEITNPTLDIYFPSPSITGYEQIEGRFDDVLYSLDFNGFKSNHDSFHNYTFDSIIIKQNPNITFDKDYSEFSSSGFVILIERILEDIILHKLNGVEETETIQIAEIINKLVENISKLSSKTLLLEYNDIITYFNYASNSNQLKSHLLQKGENLILLYDLPFRIENNKSSDPELAIQNKDRTDINLSFGIKFKLNTNLTEQYYDAIGISNNFYS